MTAYSTLAELVARLTQQRKRDGEPGSTIRVRARAVRVSGTQAYLSIVATAQRWVFCFGDTSYEPSEQSWTYRPDNDGYLTIDFSDFTPDGLPSFYGYVPLGGGRLEEVQVEVFAPWEFHIVMPGGAMG